MYKKIKARVNELMDVKDSGSTLGNILPIFVCVIVVAVLLLMFMHFMQDFTRKDNLDTIARRYVLKMEVDGYLNPANEAAMIQELVDGGMVAGSIDLMGTTRARVHYGEPIQLVIKGKMHIVSFNVDNIFATKSKKDTMDIVIRKMTTAKN